MINKKYFAKLNITFTFVLALSASLILTGCNKNDASKEGEGPNMELSVSSETEDAANEDVANEDSEPDKAMPNVSLENEAGLAVEDELEEYVVNAAIPEDLAGKNYVQKGMNAIASGKYDIAQSCFLKALEFGENKKQIYRGQGIAYMGMGYYKNAEKCLLDALSQSNGLIADVDIDISYYLAVTEYKLGKYDEAFSTYSAIIGIDPKQRDAYYMRGKVSLISGELKSAMEDYDKAIQLNPSDYSLYEKIYLDLSETGHKNEAESYIGRALDSKGKLSEYQQGVFSYYLGNYSDARNHLETARKKKETDDIIKFLGRTYEALGDTSYAMSLYETYLEENPNDGEMYNLLGMMKMNQKDYNGALKMFERGIAADDAKFRQSLMFNEVVAYEYLEEFEAARDRLEEYLLLYPDDEKAVRENKFLSTR